MQDGWSPDGTREMVLTPFRMSPVCEFTKSDLGKVDAGCIGCKHKEKENDEPL
jgi:hypothetical protein